MTEQEKYKLFGFDEKFDELLKVDGLFNRKIVAETRSFYKAYVKKCFEFGCYLNFFEVLYVHLIAMGFGRRKIEKYISKIRDDIVSYLRFSCPSAFNAVQNDVVSPNNTKKAADEI